MSEFDSPMPSVSLAGDTDGTEVEGRGTFFCATIRTLQIPVYFSFDVFVYFFKNIIFNKYAQIDKRKDFLGLC